MSSEPADRPRRARISGPAIRRARETYRMTQEELAVLLGVSARTVSNWERGSTVPRNRIGALSDALGVLPDGSGTGQPLLSEASHAELVAEIARRLGERESIPKSRRTTIRARELSRWSDSGG